MDKIPVFDLLFDENTSGVDTVSLVNDPAMESHWLALNEDSPVKFMLQSEEKRILLGALLIPDKLILRRDQEGNAFFIRFSREVIEKTALKYYRDSNTNNTNAEHQSEWTLPGVYMMGSFIKDSSIGMLPPPSLNEDHPDGTWFGFFKVEDDEVWSKYVKEGVFNGFSIEGKFPLSNSGEMADVNASNETKQEQDTYTTEMDTEKKNWLNQFLTKLVGELPETPQEETVEQFEAVLSDGVNVVARPNVEIGAELMEVKASGESPVSDGDYEMEDGRILSVEAGKITDIKEKVEEIEEPVEENAELKAELAKVSEAVATLAESMEAFKAELAKANEAKDKAESELEGFRKEAQELLTELKNEPATEAAPRIATSRKQTSKERAIAKGIALTKSKRPNFFNNN